MLEIPTTLSSTMEDLIYRTIGCCIEVHKGLGPGLVEVAYERAVCIELTDRSIPFEYERAVPILYRRRCPYSPSRHCRRGCNSSRAEGCGALESASYRAGAQLPASVEASCGAPDQLQRSRPSGGNQTFRLPNMNETVSAWNKRNRTFRVFVLSWLALSCFDSAAAQPGLCVLPLSLELLDGQLIHLAIL